MNHDLLLDTLLSIYPSCPIYDAKRAVGWAMAPGRVGSAELSTEDMVNRAVYSYIRHEFTDYNWLIRQGWDRAVALSIAQKQSKEVLESWRMLPARRLRLGA